VKPIQQESSSSIFLQDAIAVEKRSPVLYSKGEFGLDGRTGDTKTTPSRNVPPWDGS
jgi:hypothetical protein